MNMNKLSTLIAIFATLCTVSAAQVRTGIEVLEGRHFEGLVGKRVGLITNPTGVDRNYRSTIDILDGAEGVTLTALLAPEHGIRGDVYAGATFADTKDPKTGVPVYSLYGNSRKPTAQMLSDVDVLVYDIQDTGSRSYTFISTLGLVMRACAENDVEVMVLDRPNPLGGLKVEGPLVEPGFHSFVSQYAIPYIYGLTVGELAILLNEEGLNRGLKGDEEPLKCKLSVIPMEGWTRSMCYSDTGLPWILPSPNIPYPQSAVDYPSSGICGEFENYLNIGVGYTLPFAVFGAEWIDADALKEKLDSYGIPGTIFRTIHYMPTSGSKKGILLHGVQFHYSDYEAATCTLTQFYVMQAVHELYPSKDPFKLSPSRISMFDKVCGTDYVRKTFQTSFKVSDIMDFWSKDVEDFIKLSLKYRLYQ
jgi:Uncharacterized protein conserved in bacteria